LRSISNAAAFWKGNDKFKVPFRFHGHLDSNLPADHRSKGKGYLTFRMTGRTELQVELDGDDTWCQAKGIVIFSCDVPKPVLATLRASDSSVDGGDGMAHLSPFTDLAELLRVMLSEHPFAEVSDILDNKPEALTHFFL
jgi:hypothetical protein